MTDTTQQTQTTTVAEFVENGAPNGYHAFLPTFAGEQRVGYIRNFPADPWAVCPDDNAGFGMSYAVHRGTKLVLRRHACGICHRTILDDPDRRSYECPVCESREPGDPTP